MNAYAKLKELALAATPGPWASGGNWVSTQKDNASIADCSRGDEKYIAAANPAAVLGLIADNERQLDEKLAWQESEAVIRAERDALKAECEGLRKDAERYRWLRARDLDTIKDGGVFAGMTPQNTVLNEETLDEAIDAAMGQGGQSNG
jgi:hypothetical protein